MNRQRRTLAVTAVGALICLAIAAVVAGTDGIAAADRSARSAVFEVRTPWLTAVMTWVARIAVGSTVAVVTLVVVVLSAAGRRWHHAAFMAVTPLGAALINWSAKQAVDRARPDVAERLVAAAGASFPSGHAAQSVACYGAIALIVSRLIPGLRVAAWLTVAVVMVLVGFSRVYLGVHWPADVVAAWLLAGAWLTIAWIAIGSRQTLGRSTPDEADAQAH